MMYVFKRQRDHHKIDPGKFPIRTLNPLAAYTNRRSNLPVSDTRLFVRERSPVSLRPPVSNQKQVQMNVHTEEVACAVIIPQNAITG